MNERLLTGLILVSALGSALIAGVFFAFSSFVMAALARLPAPQGMAAMQSVIVTVINPAFLGTFLGTGAICLALLVIALKDRGNPRAGYLLAGGLLYLLGTVVVTLAFNVPRNLALAAVDPSAPESALLWARFVSSWTAWNHVRAAAALGAAALFILALRVPTRPG